MPRAKRGGKVCTGTRALLVGFALIIALQSYFLARVWLRHPDVVASELPSVVKPRSLPLSPSPPSGALKAPSPPAAGSAKSAGESPGAGGGGGGGAAPGPTAAPAGSVVAISEAAASPHSGAWVGMTNAYIKLLEPYKGKSPMVIIIAKGSADGRGRDLGLFSSLLGAGCTVVGSWEGGEVSNGVHSSLDKAVKALGGAVDVVLDARGGEPGGAAAIEGLKQLWGMLKQGGVYAIEGGQKWGGESQNKGTGAAWEFASKLANARAAVKWKRVQEHCAAMPVFCEESHLTKFYTGLVALHKNGLANTEIRMYGDERLPFEAGGSAMLNFIDGHKKFEERYTIIYRGPSKKPAPKIEKETRQNLEDAEASVAVSNPLHKWALKHHHGPVLWKWTGYFEFYHEAFKRWIGRSPTFLLLGVNTGGDLFMFREYFGPGARIFGVDVNSECGIFGLEEGIEVFIGSQANATFIEEVMHFIGGKVDLILDDASHDSKLTLESLKLLWKHLGGGGKGVYVIEDVGPMSELRDHTTSMARGISGLRSGEGGGSCGGLPDVCRESSEYWLSAGILAFHKNGP